jgi:hypothetical protein
VAGLAELGGDQRLELLGDVVLEHLRLLVDTVARHPQRLREVGLDQPVVADHLQRHLLAGGGEADTLVGHVVDQAQPRQAFQHRGRGRRRHLQALRDLAVEDEPVALARDRVDRLRVVLDRFGAGRALRLGGVFGGHQTETSSPVR